MFDSIVEAIAYHAVDDGDKTALIVNFADVSYKKLWRRIRQYAYLLQERGIKRDARVVLAVEYTERFIEVYFAVHWLGAVNVVVEKNASLSTIADLLQNVSPHLIVLNRSEDGCMTYELFDDTACEVSRRDFTTDSLADILYTTGTTGTPKGVMLSHRNEVAGACNVIYGGEMRKEDRNLLTMPLHHAFGLTTLRAILYKGGTAVLQEGVASIKKMNDNIQKKQCNCVYMVPSALRVLYYQTRQRLDLLLGALDKIEFCTAPLDQKMRQVLAEQLKGIRLYNSYGATESARSVYMHLDGNESRMDAIGRSVKNVSIWIVNEDRRTIASSKQNVGYLAVRGDMNMLGYYGDPCMTKHVMENGVFYSEDLGYMDEEGYIYLVGRNNDVINIGGEKVSPFEIENVALEYADVRECACIGVKDPAGIREFVPILYITEMSGKNVDVDGLRAYMEKRLEKYKVPYDIILLDEIPKNRVGKIDREELRRFPQEVEGTE